MGNTPTFITKNRRGFEYIAVTSDIGGSERNTAYHRFIEFSLGKGSWDFYDRIVSLDMDPVTRCRIDSISGLEATVAKIEAFDNAYPGAEENHPGGTGIWTCSVRSHGGFTM